MLDRTTGMFRTFNIALLVTLPVASAGLLIGGSRGALLGFAAGLTLVTLAWVCSRPLLMWLFDARPVDATSEPELVEAVERLAARANVRAPTVAVSSLPIPNALAAPTPGGGLVCVTSGLVGMLTPDELDAVLAHEIAHLAQPGRAGATLAAVFAALPGAVTAASGSDLYFDRPYRRARIRVWGGWRTHSLRDSIALASAPLAALLVRLATTPASELDADARAARMTGDPDGLARALRKLQPLAGRIAWPVNPALAHLLVIHPFGGPKLARMFNTHPPFAERLLALRAER